MKLKKNIFLWWQTRFINWEFWFIFRTLNHAANRTPEAISFCVGMPAEDTYPFKNISFECHDGTKCSIGEEECLKLSPYQGVVGFD